MDSFFVNVVYLVVMYTGENPTILNPLAERPLRVSGLKHERTIKNLDLVPPLETYKVQLARARTRTHAHAHLHARVRTRARK